MNADREMLESLEWIDTPSCPHTICPLCARTPKMGHKNDCRLGIYLQAEPERVRWKLEWAHLGPGLERLALAHRGDVWATDLATLGYDGYRFYAWVYKLPDGRVVLRAARFLPIYWDAKRATWWSHPKDGSVPIWPAEVEMVTVT